MASIHKILFLSLSLAVPLVATACQKVEFLKEEPPRGSLSGNIVYVDDGTCPNGEVRELTSGIRGFVNRKSRCVDRQKFTSNLERLPGKKWSGVVAKGQWFRSCPETSFYIIIHESKIIGEATTYHSWGTVRWAASGSVSSQGDIEMGTETTDSRISPSLRKESWDGEVTQTTVELWQEASKLCDPRGTFLAPLLASNGEWKKRADMPTERVFLAAGVVNQKIYVIGGLAADRKVLAAVEEYNPFTNKWTKKAEMPIGRLLPKSASVVNGKIYVIGGATGSRGPTVTFVEEYDPVTDTWTKKADLPAKRWGSSTSVVNGKIYVIGGFPNGGEPISTVEEYDPATDKWRKKANMLTAKALHSTTVVNGKIYVIGGAISRWYSSKTVEQYDPATDTWTQKADMPTARLALSTDVVNGKIYAIGGLSTPGGPVATVEEYDPVTDKWTQKVDMPIARFGLVTATVNGKIYAIGGAPGLSTVEEYTPEG